MSTSIDSYTQLGQVEPEPQEPGDVEPEPTPELNKTKIKMRVNRISFFIIWNRPKRLDSENGKLVQLRLASTKALVL